MPSGSTPPPIVDDGMVEDDATIGLDSGIEGIGTVEDTLAIELEVGEGVIDVTDSVIVENITNSDSDIVENEPKQYILNLTDAPNVG